MKLKNITKLQLAVMAEDQFRKHMQSLGVDTSSYPSGQRHVPELGVTYTETYYPDHTKKYFHKWIDEVFLPEMLDLKEKK